MPHDASLHPCCCLTVPFVQHSRARAFSGFAVAASPSLQRALVPCCFMFLHDRPKLKGTFPIAFRHGSTKAELRTLLQPVLFDRLGIHGDLRQETTLPPMLLANAWSLSGCALGYGCIPSRTVGSCLGGMLLALPLQTLSDFVLLIRSAASQILRSLSVA